MRIWHCGGDGGGGEADGSYILSDILGSGFPLHDVCWTRAGNQKADAINF